MRDLDFVRGSRRPAVRKVACAGGLLAALVISGGAARAEGPPEAAAATPGGDPAAPGRDTAGAPPAAATSAGKTAVSGGADAKAPVGATGTFELGVPLVRFVADRPGVALYRSRDDAPVCEAPCGKLVDARQGDSLYFGGPGVASSDPLRLEWTFGEMRYRVQTAPRWKNILGRVLTFTGLGAAGAGAISFGTTIAAIGGAGDGTVIAGEMALLVGGLVMLVGGASLRQHNMTTVELASGAPLGFTF